MQKHRREYKSLSPVVDSIATKLGCVPHTLLTWTTPDDGRDAKVKELEREISWPRLSKTVNDFLIYRSFKVTVIALAFTCRSAERAKRTA